MYSFTGDPEVSWGVVRSGEQIEASAKELAATKFFSWDVETSGKNPWKDRHIVGHSFAWRRSNGQIRSVYFPIRHKGYLGMFDQPSQLDPDTVTRALKIPLEMEGTKAGHNLSFDTHFAYRDGIHVRGPIHDTMVGEKLRDENHKNYQLDTCMKRSPLKHDPEWGSMLGDDLKAQAKALHTTKTKLVDEHGYELVTVDRLGLYAAQDAVYEFRLAEWQQQFMGRIPQVWANEMELFWVFVEMARIGVPVATKVLSDLADEQNAILAELTPRIWKLAGEEFEVTNDNAVRKILFTKMGYKPRGTTDSGAFSLDDDVLWALETEDHSEIAHLLRKYNSSEKIVSTYTNSIVDLVDAQGILHPSFDQGGAATGRASCREPNLQNIPVKTPLGRKVREAFVTRPGMVRYCCDYSQIELRILAHLTQDPLLLKIYREGLDAHSSTALEVFGTDKKVDGVDMRRIAKILNFGTSFCMTEVGLMKNVNKDLPAGQKPIDKARATHFLNSFYSKYTGVNSYRQSLWYQVRRNNGVFWNIFGRPRNLPDINDSMEWIRNAAERQAISTMVQGSAADLVKQSMVQVYRYIKSQTDCETYMVLMIHDDLQFDMAHEGSAKTIREIKRLMEQTCQPKISIPVKCDVEYFLTNWNEKKKMVFG